MSVGLLGFLCRGNLTTIAGTVWLVCVGYDRDPSYPNLKALNETVDCYDYHGALACVTFLHLGMVLHLCNVLECKC